MQKGLLPATWARLNTIDRSAGREHPVSPDCGLSGVACQKHLEFGLVWQVETRVIGVGECLRFLQS